MNERIEKMLAGQSIPVEDIPKIDLYMDQLLGLFEDHFDSFRRTDEDKILTKTMINNYVKAKVVMRPEKKKYGIDHTIQLAMLYQLKGVLSIHDLHTLNQGIGKVDGSLEEVYREFLAMEEETLTDMGTYLEQYKSDLSADDKMRMISKLLIESSIKKRLAEMLLDEFEETLTE